jgi:AcrR family transcriptional regulator
MARARLQQERSRATRQAIIEAAEQLWRERDFDSASVEDVCQAAGVAKGTFYFYFPRKEHLLVMLVFGRMLPKESELKIWLASDLSTAEICRQLVSGIAGRVRRMDRELVRRGVEESFRHFREIGRLTGGDRSLRTYLDPIFERGVSRGEVDPSWRRDILDGLMGWAILQEIFLWGSRQIPGRRMEPHLLERVQLITNGAARPRAKAKPAPVRPRARAVTSV